MDERLIRANIKLSDEKKQLEYDVEMLTNKIEKIKQYCVEHENPSLQIILKIIDGEDIE